MWRCKIMTKINRLVFNDGTQMPSFKFRTSASSLHALCFFGSQIKFPREKLQYDTRTSRSSPWGAASEGTYAQVPVLSRRTDTPVSNLAHDKQRVEVSQEHLGDWHKGNYSSCVGATQNFWTFSFSNHTWWIEWEKAIIWFLAGSLSVVGLCWLMISAASHQKRKLSISV